MSPTIAPGSNSSMKELCSSTESALGSILNWRKGLAAPEEGCEERRTNPTPFRVWLQIVGHMSSCRIVGHPELRAIRNVWSAAILQAKNEDDRIGLRECIRPLSE